MICGKGWFIRVMPWVITVIDVWQRLTHSENTMDLYIPITNGTKFQRVNVNEISNLVNRSNACPPSVNLLLIHN